MQLGGACTLLALLPILLTHSSAENGPCSAPANSHVAGALLSTARHKSRRRSSWTHPHIHCSHKRCLPSMDETVLSAEAWGSQAAQQSIRRWN